MQRKAVREEKCATIELEHHRLWKGYQMRNAGCVFLLEDNETAASVAVNILSEFDKDIDQV